MKFGYLFTCTAILFSQVGFGVCNLEATQAMDVKARQYAFLGSPTTAPFNLPAGSGCGRHYQAGSVYFRPCIGAVEVHGLIRNLWAGMSWETGALGFPISDELPMTDGVGRVSFFQGGTVYYHPSFGTRLITPAFHREWRDRGGVGTLGYPTSDMRCNLGSDRCQQSFERGTVSQRIGERPASVDLRQEIARRSIAIRDQAKRDTCSVHTITFLLEYAYTALCGFNRFNNLSEEYLNHMTNVATGRQDDGDFFHNIIAGYNKYGMVSEATVPFMATYNFNGFALPAGAETAGKKALADKKLEITVLKAIGTPMGLTDAEFNAILSALGRGVPVGLGRGHSMPIVGYRLDSAQPGGGAFIFRNSYGLVTGNNGYQEEDFASVRATASDAIFVEPLIH